MHRSLSCLFFASAIALYAPAAEAATVANIQVIATPTEIGPGGSTSVTIIASDAAGAPVGGAALNVLASGGTATAIVDYGNGTYAFAYTAPTDASSVMLVVTNADGSVSTAAGLTLNPSLKPNKVVAPVAPVGPVAVKEPKPAKTPRAPREPREPRANTGTVDAPIARVRVGVGGGMYNYAQERTPNTDSPLWPENVYLGGDNGEAGPGKPFVFEARAQAWLPAVPYVGFDGHFRLGNYKVQWPGASSAIPDNLPHGSALLAARYPFATAGGAQMHVGARAGLLYGEFITYQTGETEKQLDYPNIPIYSAGVGADFGAEFGAAYVNLSALVGVRGGTAYSKNGILEVGYTPDGMPVGIAGSVQYSSRSIDIVAGSDLENVLGTLTDSTFLATVGPTVVF